jgi:hypothetical protein
MAWSGVLIDGVGRGCPVSKNFTLDAAGNKVWAPLADCRGSYYTLPVSQGTSLD